MVEAQVAVSIGAREMAAKGQPAGPPAFRKAGVFEFCFSNQPCPAVTRTAATSVVLSARAQLFAASRSSPCTHTAKMKKARIS